MPPKGRIKGKINWGKPDMRAAKVDLCYVDPKKEKARRARIQAVRPIYKKPPMPETILNPPKTNLVGANGHGIRKIPPPPANKAKK